MFTSTVEVVEKGGRLHTRIEHQAHGDLHHRIEIALPTPQSKTLEDAQEAAEVLQRQLIMLVRHTAALVSKEWQESQATIDEQRRSPEMTHADERLAAVLNDHLNGVGTSIQLEGDGRWHARSQNGDHVSSNSVADLITKIVDSYFYLRDRLPSGGI